MIWMLAVRESLLQKPTPQLFSDLHVNTMVCVPPSLQATLKTPVLFNCYDF